MRDDFLSSEVGSAPGSPAALAPEATHRLVAGDNARALHALARAMPGEVTLAYLDPPFFTGRKHERVERTRTEGGIERQTTVAFDDRWGSLADYLGALEERLRSVRALLRDRGSVVVHVDTKTSHYVRVLCDEIFGIDCFASEVIWRYRRWPSKTKNFQRVHDVMLRYVKNPDVEPTFHQLYEPLAASTRATWGTKKQRAVTNENGRRLRSSTEDDESPGVPLGDVWEIGIVAPVAKERTGYPTQKPLALLERWIASCSSPGDLVLDPYGGSGTTMVAAARLGRRSLLIDESREALSVMRARATEIDLAITECSLDTIEASLGDSPQPSGTLGATSDDARDRDEMELPEAESGVRLRPVAPAGRRPRVTQSPSARALRSA